MTLKRQILEAFQNKKTQDLTSRQTKDRIKNKLMMIGTDFNIFYFY